MTESDPKNSVQDEQFGNPEDMNENDTSKELTEEPENISELQSSDKPDENQTPAAVSAEIAEEEKVVAPPVKKKKEKVKEPVESVLAEDDTDIVSIDDLTLTEEEPQHEEHIHLPSLKEIDFTSLSKETLVDTLRNYISEFPLERIRDHVEIIKSVFYKKHNDEIEDIRQNFLKDGGHPEDFKVEDSPVEINMKELLNIYRDKRNDMSKNIEEQKDSNLQLKQDIIESIKELINSQESLNKTFHDFRNLQDRWREIGPVPQKNVKDFELIFFHTQ